MPIRRSVARYNARPARIIGYIRMIPPLVFVVDHCHVRSHCLNDAGHHQTDAGAALQVSAFILPVATSLATRFPTSSKHGQFDLRVRTEVLMSRRSSWSPETAID